MSHKNGATCKITIKNGIVTKKVINFLEHDTFGREIFWLKYLNGKGYKWCPKLLKINTGDRSFDLTYAGDRICRANAPIDWRGQLQAILSDLAAESLEHNDIKSSDLLVNGNRLFLIDYGWTARGGDWSCGGRFNRQEKPHHHFKDSGAIQRIEKSLGAVDRYPEEKIVKFVEILQEKFGTRTEWDGGEVLKIFWESVFY